MGVINLILTVAGIVIGSMIAVAPLVIASRLGRILEEQRRHDRAVEVKIDIIHDILKDIADGGREYEEDV